MLACKFYPGRSLPAAPRIHSSGSRGVTQPARYFLHGQRPHAVRLIAGDLIEVVADHIHDHIGQAVSPGDAFFLGVGLGGRRLIKKPSFRFLCRATLQEASTGFLCT